MSGETGIRQAEMAAVLAAATALALGYRPATMLGGTSLAVAFARSLGWAADEIETVYWYGLLRYCGCHAENHLFSALVGDEIAFNREYGLIDTGNPAELLPLVVGLVRKAHASLGPAGIEALLAASLPDLQTSAEFVIEGHCDVAQRLSARLGLSPEIVHALGQFRERWDGKGLPHHLAGEDLDRAVRLVFLCHDVAVLTAVLGHAAAIDRITQRRGTAYEPVLVDAFLEMAGEFRGLLNAGDPWRQVLDAEPGEQRTLSRAELDDACLVLADFCDLQLPEDLSHSRSVASLAEAAGRVAGLEAADLEDLRHAALLHDLGYAAVPVRARGGHSETLNTNGDVRLHPFHGEDLLQRIAALRQVAALVGRHHEACDGSGYYRGVNRADLGPAACLLAAAEAYQSLLEGRFGRPGRGADAAAMELRALVTAGKLDGDAVKAVLSAAGHKVPVKKRQRVSGLTGRELEILRLVATGLSMKEVGERLGISPKTVDNHLQNLYPKIEVKTRAGATLFAIEHGLCTLPK